MKKMFFMAAFAAFSFAANAQTQATASTTDAAPAPAKKACCASMAKTECATMSKAECAKAMSEGKCAEGSAAKTSMTTKTEKANSKKVAANKP